MDRSSKVEFVQTFNEKVGRARLAIVADYQGIDVNTLTEFRKSLATEDAEFSVVKNRLVKLAVAGTSFEGLNAFLSGPNAVLLGFDAVVEATKALTQFAKDNESLELKGGVLDGKPVTPAQIAALADLPSKEVLQAMLLGVLQAPARNLVSLLANCNRQLLNVLVAYRDQLEESA